MLTEVQLYMSTSFQPGSRVIRAFSDVEKPFLFFDLAVKAAKSENKEDLSTSEKALISSRVNKFYRPGRRENNHSDKTQAYSVQNNPKYNILIREN